MHRRGGDVLCTIVASHMVSYYEARVKYHTVMHVLMMHKTSQCIAFYGNSPEKPLKKNLSYCIIFGHLRSIR
jgi:hypothetical protein